MPITSAKAICMAFSASRTTWGTFLLARMAWMPPPPTLSLAALASVSEVRWRTFSAHFIPPFFSQANADWCRSVKKKSVAKRCKVIQSPANRLPSGSAGSTRTR